MESFPQPAPALSAYMSEIVDKSSLQDTLLFGSIGILIAAILVTSVILGYFYRQTTDYHKYDPDLYGSRWDGFRGLVVLLGIALLAEAARSFIALLAGWYCFSEPVWLALTSETADSYHPWWRFTLQFIIISRSAEFIAGLFLLVLYVMKRRMLRHALSLYLLFALTSLLLRDVCLSQIFEAGNFIITENYREFLRMLQVSFLLLPYVYFSRRVHSTFRY